MTELEKYKLEFEDLPGYESVLARLKVFRLKRAWKNRKKAKNATN